MPRLRSTTILAVRTSAGAALGGDGQVTLGNVVMKGDANKIRQLLRRQGAGRLRRRRRRRLRPAGAVRGQAERLPGRVPRAATELAKDWRTDRVLRRLEAMLVVVDRDHLLLLSGTGDVIQPTDGVAAIGSGGPYALAAARALMAHTQADAGRDRPRRPGDRRRPVHLHEPEHRSRRVVNRCRDRTERAISLLSGH